MIFEWFLAFFHLPELAESLLPGPKSDKKSKYEIKLSFGAPHQNPSMGHATFLT